MPFPEQQARIVIDRMLIAAGWVIQDYSNLNLRASLGVAVREFPVDNGTADYMLFVDGKAAGVLEAKREGHTLSGVADQTGDYVVRLRANVRRWTDPLPFGFESTGKETQFIDLRDPMPRSRRIFSFFQPKTLYNWIRESSTLRLNLQHMPTLDVGNLRQCQIEAVTGLEQSLADNRPRALIQSATGSGKTYTAVTASYRLLQHGHATRILFLVDRKDLGIQTINEFQQFIVPEDGRKFTEVYTVQHLTGPVLDPTSKVIITTIQRLYALLRGEPFDESAEEAGGFEEDEQLPPNAPTKDVIYNPNIPIEMFDFIITDECHRSIYNLWRQVLEYFDAFLIGLTATPSKQTLGFFNQNLVMEYAHERAVADGVNVGYEIYRIKTKIGESGSIVEAGFHIDKRDKKSRVVRWEELTDDLTYSANVLDTSVVAPDQIRTVIRTFKEKLFTEIFPDRTDVPKTLIFAKDDSHAEDIVHIVREEFGVGNDFCKKITYRTPGEKSDTLIKSFRNSYNPRIAVTVDMMSTGMDIKPLECLIFMRNVKSQVYFEQMKGRGTRTIDVDDLQAVTRDAKAKTHFAIVDAVGVTESDKTDSRPLERKPSLGLERLLMQVAQGDRSTDMLTTLAGRLARLQQRLGDRDKERITATAAGKSLSHMANALLDAVDPDQWERAARLQNGEKEPDEQALKQAQEQLADIACEPFDHPELRQLLVALQSESEQIIDIISQDNLLYAGFDEEKAKRIITDFRAFMESHKDELDGLQLFYSRPFGERHVTFEQIKQLAEAVQQPPYHLTPNAVWMAYERLEKDKVKHGDPQRLLTDLVSLIRFTLGESQELEPFAETVEQRFGKWLEGQNSAGVAFSAEQLDWLHMIRDHIKTSMAVQPEDLEYAPFVQKGGVMKLTRLFGSDWKRMLQELTEVLSA